MEVPDAMISEESKKKAGYEYYMAKKVKSEKAKIIDEQEEQHVSLIKSGRGKGFMCYDDQVVNVPNKLKKDVMPRKTISLTIDEEAVVDLWKRSKATRLKSLRKKKQLVAGEESISAYKKYYSTSDIVSDATLYSSSSDKLERSANETDDADEFDMDLSNDNPHGDDDDARYGVFMHNKSIVTPNSTYLSLTITSSSLDFIQTLLDETPTNELMDFMSHPMYTDAQTTSVMHNLEGNIELTSYISGASEVPLGTHLDVIATKTFMQEMFPDKYAYRILSLPAKKSLSYNNSTTKLTISQSKEADAKGKKEYEAVQLQEGSRTKIQRIKSEARSSYKFQHALDAQAAQSSFHKRSHDNQNTPNNREGENKKKHQKDVDIDKDENHILGPSTVAIAKKFKELIQKDSTRLEWLKVQYNNDVELEYHVSQLKEALLSKAQWNNLSTEEKYTTSMTKNYATRYYKEGIEDRVLKRWSKEVRRYHFEVLNVRRSDDKEYEFNYADLPRLSVNDVEDMNRVEVIQLGVESYQTTLNLTKPIIFFEGIDQRIPFTMTATHKGVVHLNQYNIKSPMKLSEVKKFSDGTLVKIQENLIDMLLKNKLGSSNKRLKGRDWTDYVVKSSREILKKIDEILRHKKQLRRLEEYVGGRPKTINPRTFVRPL
nr:hypothetical protein [Tanacetum cinerariifolium]